MMKNDKECFLFHAQFLINGSQDIAVVGFQQHIHICRFWLIYSKTVIYITFEYSFQIWTMAFQSFVFFVAILAIIVFSYLVFFIERFEL